MKERGAIDQPEGHVTPRQEKTSFVLSKLPWQQEQLVTI